MKKAITSFNDKKKAHGYWQVYYTNGRLWAKCYYINGRRVGYEEYYSHEINPKNEYAIIFNL